jgi:hypothetical protein
MCSFSASPVPTPRKNRPGIMAAVVAAACAITAGWMRTVGQVTAVPTSIRSVAAAIAPSAVHTNGLWPCRCVHGWKWSDTVTKSNPACSARRASPGMRDGSSSSLERW